MYDYYSKQPLTYRNDEQHKRNLHNLDVAKHLTVNVKSPVIGGMTLLAFDVLRTQ